MIIEINPESVIKVQNSTSKIYYKRTARLKVGSNQKH